MMEELLEHGMSLDQRLNFWGLLNRSYEKRLTRQRFCCLMKKCKSRREFKSRDNIEYLRHSCGPSEMTDLLGILK